MKIGQKVKIKGTNSIWDGKEGILEEINEDVATVFVNFIPEQQKRVRQDFNIENVEETLEEAYKNKETGEIGDILKNIGDDYVLFQNDKGEKSTVAFDNLEEIDDEEGIKEMIHVKTTPSFDEDFNSLDNPNEAKWFLEDSGKSSLFILRVNGLEATIKMKRAKQESISNNGKYKGSTTVYSLFKGEGSGNQFRAYFYRKGDTCIFVRCLLKKQTKNGPQEDKAIQDTINYASNH